MTFETVYHLEEECPAGLVVKETVNNIAKKF